MFTPVLPWSTYSTRKYWRPRMCTHFNSAICKQEFKTQFIWNCTLQKFIFLRYTWSWNGSNHLSGLALKVIQSRENVPHSCPGLLPVFNYCLQMAELKCVHIRGLQYLRVVYVLQGWTGVVLHQQKNPTCLTVVYLLGIGFQTVISCVSAALSSQNSRVYILYD